MMTTLDMQTEIFTGIAAAAAPFITALFQRVHWSSAVKRIVALVVSVVLATVTVIVNGVTDWSDILTVAAMVIAGSQVIYSAVYPAAKAVTRAATPTVTTETTDLRQDAGTENMPDYATASLDDTIAAVLAEARLTVAAETDDGDVELVEDTADVTTVQDNV
ncbi:MAG: hypothetical protein E7Z96_02725 [Actinomycetaceae bacterium]|nr:hypothetical protein [Actinomycetaceae bacterium]